MDVSPKFRCRVSAKLKCRVLQLESCWALPVGLRDPSMRQAELVTLNMRELDRLKMGQAVCEWRVERLQNDSFHGSSR